MTRQTRLNPCLVSGALLATGLAAALGAAAANAEEALDESAMATGFKTLESACFSCHSPDAAPADRIAHGRDPPPLPHGQSHVRGFPLRPGRLRQRPVGCQRPHAWSGEPLRSHAEAVLRRRHPGCGGLLPLSHAPGQARLVLCPRQGALRCKWSGARDGRRLPSVRAAASHADQDRARR